MALPALRREQSAAVQFLLELQNAETEMSQDQHAAPHDEPAFPIGEPWCSYHGIRQGQRGMTLRDYFAAAALTGLMSDEGMRPVAEAEFEHMAKRLYQVADAMLKARGT